MCTEEMIQRVPQSEDSVTTLILDSKLLWEGTGILLCSRSPHLMPLTTEALLSGRHPLSPVLFFSSINNKPKCLSPHWLRMGGIARPGELTVAYRPRWECVSAEEGS